jgi:hypothetical protein
MSLPMTHADELRGLRKGSPAFDGVARQEELKDSNQIVQARRIILILEFYGHFGVEHLAWTVLNRHLIRLFQQSIHHTPY